MMSFVAYCVRNNFLGRLENSGTDVDYSIVVYIDELCAL